MYRILGIDPGLSVTGWGVVDFDGYRLKYAAHGVIATKTSQRTSDRLSFIFKKLSDVIEMYAPQEASIEEVFVNKNPISSLKLGMARGAAVCCAGVLGLQIFEYTPNKIKKSVVGVGHASKEQVIMMVQRLLNCSCDQSDSADALAIAICHAHNKNNYSVMV